MIVNTRYDIQDHREWMEGQTRLYFTSVIRRSDNKQFLAVPFKRDEMLEAGDPAPDPNEITIPKNLSEARHPVSQTTEFDENGEPVLWQENNLPRLDGGGNRIFRDTSGFEVIKGITTRDGKPCHPYGDGEIDLPEGYEGKGQRRIKIHELLAQRRAKTRNRSKLDILLPIAATSVSRILHHPNIVSLVDIVDETSTAWAGPHSGIYSSFFVWQDMNAGNIAKLLPSFIPPYEDTNAWTQMIQPNPQRFSLPESLCWHVLTSISRALLWLHFGAKETADMPGDWAFQDEDWQTIFHRDINPTNIFFTKPRSNETYGQCKLGGFEFCKLAFDIIEPEVEVPADMKTYNQYFWSPEIYKHEQTYGMPSEIYALGAVLYNMMTGMPPPRSQGHQYNMSRMNDRGFSTGLRAIVEHMLNPISWQRPSTLQLYNFADEGFRKWRATTLDGGRYVDVKDHALADTYVEAQQWHQERAMKGTRWEDWETDLGAL